MKFTKANELLYQLFKHRLIAELTIGVEGEQLFRVSGSLRSKEKVIDLMDKIDGDNGR